LSPWPYVCICVLTVNNLITSTVAHGILKVETRTLPNKGR
jgi:bacterioferritin-associated ferredoxin